MNTDFLDQLEGQLKVDKNAACRRAIERILAIIKKRRDSSFFVIGIDLTGRPLQLYGLGELLSAPLTDRFVRAFVVVPANRFEWIVSAAEGTF